MQVSRALGVGLVLATCLASAVASGSVPDAAAPAPLAAPAEILAPVQQYVSALNHKDGAKACRQLTPEYRRRLSALALYVTPPSGHGRPTCRDVFIRLTGFADDGQPSYRSARLVSARVVSQTATDASLALVLRVSRKGARSRTVTVREPLFVGLRGGRWLVRKQDPLLWVATGTLLGDDTSVDEPLTPADADPALTPAPAVASCAGERLGGVSDRVGDTVQALGYADGGPVAGVPSLDLAAAGAFADGRDACLSIRTVAPPRAGTTFEVWYERGGVRAARVALLVGHGGRVVVHEAFGAFYAGGSPAAQAGYDGAGIVVRLSQGWGSVTGRLTGLSVTSGSFRVFEPEIPEDRREWGTSDVVAMPDPRRGSASSG